MEWGCARLSRLPWGPVFQLFCRDATLAWKWASRRALPPGTRPWQLPHPVVRLRPICRASDLPGEALHAHADERQTAQRRAARQSAWWPWVAHPKASRCTEQTGDSGPFTGVTLGNRATNPTERYWQKQKESKSRVEPSGFKGFS